LDLMRGSFRGPARAKIRDQWRENVVPKLAAREIKPLLRFYPDHDGLTVLDIGANKGLWTRALLDVFGGRIAHVHLFDPSPENYSELTNRGDNLVCLSEDEFTRLSVHRFALGREPGTAVLYTNDEGSPLGSLYPHEEPGWGERLKEIRLSESLEVPVETVDRYLARERVPRVEIMKIDTEGHEMDVLLGAEQAIQAGRIDVITFEFGVHQVESRHFFKDYWLYLTKRGYALYFVNDAGAITPLERYEYRWEQFNRNFEFIAARLPVQNPAASRPHADALIEDAQRA
jgi:FkbM family methyltransferase